MVVLSRKALFISLSFLFFIFATSVYSQELTGSITLPPDVVADGDIRVNLQVIEHDEFEFPERFFPGLDLIIPDGQSSVNYQVPDFSPTVINSQLAVNLRCSSNCDQVTNGLDIDYFLQTGGASLIEEQFALLPFNSVSNPLDLQFPTPPAITTLTGAISLPTGVVADGNVEVELSIIEYDSDEGYIRYLGEVFSQVESGESQLSFEISYRTPAPDSLLEVRLSCRFNCSEVDGNFNTYYYLQSQSSSLSDSRTFVPVGNVVTPLNLQFPTVELTTLEGTISLPPGEVADGDIDLDLNLIGLHASQSITVLDGESSASYNVTFRTPEEGASIQLTIGCLFNCFSVDNNLRTLYYLQTDGFSLKEDFAEVPIENISSPLDLQFPTIEGLTLAGNIQLPVGVVAQGEVMIDLFIDLYDANGNVIRTLGSQSVTISNGESSVDYLRTIRIRSADTQLRIELVCRSSCSQIGDGAYYLQSNGLVLNRQFALVPLSNISEPLNLQYPSVIAPDPFEEDDRIAQAREISPKLAKRHTLHDSADQDWSRFMIKKPVEVEIVGNSFGRDKVRIMLFDEEQNLVATNDDEIDGFELSDASLSRIKLAELSPGTYFIKADAYSFGLIAKYSLALKADISDEELCFPIPTTNNKAVLICL